MTTPLHAALGRPGTDLTIGLLREACEQKIPETEQLDFKRDLPLPAGDATKDETLARSLELAKDLAAMANSRGGMLVYGVRDENDRAVELKGVPDLSDGVMVRRIRQVGYNMIYPPVQVQCHKLVEDDGGTHALVVEIAESPDAPHLVQPKRDGGNEGWLMAPYRSGPDTHNMLEKQLEGAYRQRIDGRRRQARDLRKLHDELTQRHAGGDRPTTGSVVLLARPHRLRSGALPYSDRDVVYAVEGAGSFAHQLQQEIAKSSDDYPITLFRRAGGPRRGLRRYIFSETARLTLDDGSHSDPPARIVLEVHDDGTIGLVWQRGACYTSGGIPVRGVPAPSLGESDMDVMAILMAALITTVGDDLDLTSDYSVRVGIVPFEPVWLIRTDAWEDSRKVPSPPVVEADLRVTASPDVRAMDLLAFGLDLVNMVERSESALDHLWDRPRGSMAGRNLGELARRLFGGETDHPTRGPY